MVAALCFRYSCVCRLASARNLRGGEQVLKGDVSEAAEYWADAHDTRKLSTVHWFADKPAATVSGRSGKTVAAVSGRSDIPVVTISGSLGSHSAAASNTAVGRSEQHAEAMP